jgi:hypothetical protein
MLIAITPDKVLIKNFFIILFPPVMYFFTVFGAKLQLNYMHGLAKNGRNIFNT